MPIEGKVEMEHRKKQGKRGRRRATSAQTGETSEDLKLNRKVNR